MATDALGRPVPKRDTTGRFVKAAARPKSARMVAETPSATPKAKKARAKRVAAKATQPKPAKGTPKAARQSGLSKPPSLEDLLRDDPARAARRRRAEARAEQARRSRVQQANRASGGRFAPKTRILISPNGQDPVALEKILTEQGLERGFDYEFPQDRVATEQQWLAENE